MGLYEKLLYWQQIHKVDNLKTEKLVLLLNWKTTPQSFKGLYIKSAFTRLVLEHKKHRAKFCCGGKSRAASAQSFTMWQQVIIEIMRSNHSVIACSRHVYMGVILRAHPGRGESHVQRNTNGEVATVQSYGGQMETALQHTAQSTDRNRVGTRAPTISTKPSVDDKSRSVMLFSVARKLYKPCNKRPTVYKRPSTRVTSSISRPSARRVQSSLPPHLQLLYSSRTSWDGSESALYEAQTAGTGRGRWCPSQWGLDRNKTSADNGFLSTEEKRQFNRDSFTFTDTNYMTWTRFCCTHWVKI